MANNNESTMKWKVDITQLKAAMQEAKRAISQANAQFKTATAGMDKWSKSTTGLEAKLKQLNQLLPAQKRQLQILEEQYKDTVKRVGENSTAAHDLKIKIEDQRATIVKTETSIKKYNAQLDDMKVKEAEANSASGKLKKTIEDQEKAVSDLKKEYANAVIQYGEHSKEAKNLAKQIKDLSGELADNKQKLDDAEKSADEFDKSIEDAGASARDAANGGFTVLKGAMANLVAQGISKAIEGLKQLASKVVEVGKESIAEYSNYEQLIGGVETLFKDSAKVVEGYANSAYKTAGLSANEYMETVTSFSASLLQGLNGDTAAAAKIADMAITDMSDNANKMGSDMASLQNAYQGFAKGNFTMLDNLKLGYGGTKEEMLRLVKDAGVVNDSVESINDVSFDQIIEAIHIIQDEIGITGTTSKEAATTIEGSKKSMQASWKNLLKEIAKDNGDIEGAFNQFADSMITYGQNLLPRIKTLVGNVVDFAVKELRKRFPELMKTIDGIVEVIKTVFGAIKDVFNFVKNNGDAIIATITGIATAVGVYLAYQTALKIMTQGWKSLAIVQKAVALGQAALNAVMALNPIGLVIAAIAGLIAAFVVLWNKSEAFREFWINLWEVIKEAALSAWEWIKNAASEVWEWIKGAWESAGQFFSDLWDGIKNSAADAWGSIKEIWQVVKDWFNNTIIQPVSNFFGNMWDKLKNGGKNAWEGIKNTFKAIPDWFREKFSNAWQKVKDVFSTGGKVFDGIKEGITNAFKTVVNAIIKGINKVVAIPFNAINNVLNKLRSLSILGVSPFGWLGSIAVPQIPLLARGGVLKRGQIGLLEGSGAEAVVPLEQNKQWIAAVVKGMIDQMNINGLKGNMNSHLANMNGAYGSMTQNVTFNQTINSPKAVDRLSLYRETNSLLFSAKVRLANV